MRSITWAVRLTFADGRKAFVRQGGRIGRGAIETFPVKSYADTAAGALRVRFGAQSAEVIERSHGRQWPDVELSPRTGAERRAEADPLLAAPETKNED